VNKSAERPWSASAAFLAAKLASGQAELSGVVLNRTRWDSLRDDCRLLVFLQERVGAPDFDGIRVELARIAEGRIRVPALTSPRRKATDCLRLWDQELRGLESGAAIEQGDEVQAS